MKPIKSMRSACQWIVQAVGDLIDWAALDQIPNHLPAAVSYILHHHRQSAHKNAAAPHVSHPRLWHT